MHNRERGWWMPAAGEQSSWRPRPTVVTFTRRDVKKKYYNKRVKRKRSTTHARESILPDEVNESSTEVHVNYNGNFNSWKRWRLSALAWIRNGHSWPDQRSEQRWLLRLKLRAWSGKIFHLLWTYHQSMLSTMPQLRNMQANHCSIPSFVRTLLYVRISSILVL